MTDACCGQRQTGVSQLAIQQVYLYLRFPIESLRAIVVFLPGTIQISDPVALESGLHNGKSIFPRGKYDVLDIWLSVERQSDLPNQAVYLGHISFVTLPIDAERTLDPQSPNTSIERISGSSGAML